MNKDKNVYCTNEQNKTWWFQKFSLATKKKRSWKKKEKQTNTFGFFVSNVQKELVVDVEGVNSNLKLEDNDLNLAKTQNWSKFFFVLNFSEVCPKASQAFFQRFSLPEGKPKSEDWRNRAEKKTMLPAILIIFCKQKFFFFTIKLWQLGLRKTNKRKNSRFLWRLKFLKFNDLDDVKVCFFSKSSFWGS